MTTDIKVARLSPVRILAWIPGALLLLPRLLFPMQMDQYFHHYLGWRLLHGGLPYVASFDQNFPGGAILYAMGIAIFGQSSLGFAVYDLLVQGFTCYLIVHLARRYDPSGTASWIAPILYTLTYIGLGVWDVGQRDSFIAPMLVGLLLLLTSGRITARMWVGAGLLVGAMSITRPLFAFAGLLILAVWLWRHGSVKDLWRVVAGAAALPVVVILTYLSIGHLNDLYQATIAFNLEVYGKFRHGINLRGSGSMTILLVSGVALYFLSKPKLRDSVLLVCALLIAPISTWIQGQGDPHHSTPSYAIAAALAGLGFAWMIQQIGRRSSVAASVAAVLITIVILWRGSDRIPFGLVAEHLRDVPLRTLYEAQSRGDVKLEEEFSAADYIRSHTVPSDPIYIFSMRIWPYELSDRLPPTRFQSPEHLIMQPADQPLTSEQRVWRSELISSLEMRPPKYILITTTDQMWLYPHAEASIDQVKRFPAFDSLLTLSYAIDTVIGAYRIYERSHS
jgi:hypothetical protein